MDLIPALCLSVCCCAESTVSPAIDRPTSPTVLPTTVGVVATDVTTAVITPEASTEESTTTTTTSTTEGNVLLSLRITSKSVMYWKNSGVYFSGLLFC